MIRTHIIQSDNERTWISLIAYLGTNMAGILLQKTGDGFVIKPSYMDKYPLYVSLDSFQPRHIR
jgi:hypothetical protein